MINKSLHWRLFPVLILLLIIFNGNLFADTYRLVWEDNFNSVLLDEKKWNVEFNYQNIPNRELQAYIPRNVTIGREPVTGNSCLILTAKKENFLGRPATSGRVNTRGKFDFMYGKIEARIKLPKTANGLWPAFWLLGADDGEIGWPACGEIDIVEMGIEAAYRNNKQEYFNSGCVHFGNTNSNTGHTFYSVEYISDYSLQDNDFHLFTMIWDIDKIEMYVDLDKYPDQKPYFSIRLNNMFNGYFFGDYFRKPYYITLNLAVGGVFPDIFDINGITALNSTNNYEAGMYIDFIRVYQKENDYKRPIVFLGDSITAGFNATGNRQVDSSMAFPAIVQEFVNAPVINAGISGDTTYDANERLVRDVLQVNPQIVIIFLGINDLFEDHGYWFTDFYLTNIVSALHSAVDKIYLVKFLPDFVIRWNLETKGKTTGEQYYQVAQYNELYNRLSLAYDAVIIDDIWDDVWHIDTPDGLHPDTAGHKKMASRIIDFMEPFLR